MKNHQQIDDRSLAMHQLVVEKIKANPALFDVVRDTLNRWSSIVCVRSQPYVKEWSALASLGEDVCLQMAVEDSEHARALRQASPFTGILSNQERFAFLNQWVLAHEAH